MSASENNYSYTHSGNIALQLLAISVDTNTTNVNTYYLYSCRHCYGSYDSCKLGRGTTANPAKYWCVKLMGLDRIRRILDGL